MCLQQWWLVLTQLEHRLTLDCTIRAGSASHQHRCPALLSLAAAVSIAARAEEASAMSDDYQSDRKAFCFWGYLAACRGHDVNTGGQKDHLTITASNCCAQTTSDDTTATFNHLAQQQGGCSLLTLHQESFHPGMFIFPLRSDFHLIVLLLLLLLLFNAALKMVKYNFLRNMSDGKPDYTCDRDLALYCDQLMSNYLLKSSLHGSNSHTHQLMYQLTLLFTSK